MTHYNLCYCNIYELQRTNKVKTTIQQNNCITGQLNFPADWFSNYFNFIFIVFF
jgi:hypothetical protein